MKVQTTVNGYSAWVLQRLAEEKGETIAEIAKVAIDRWVDDNRSYLSRMGVTRKEYKELSNHSSGVITFPTSS